MRIRPLLSELLLLAPAAASAQFQGTLHYRLTMTEERSSFSGDWTVRIGKAGWRSEMRTASPAASVREGAPAEFRLVALGRPAEPEVSYFVNDARRVYTAIRGEKDDEEEEDGEKWTSEKKGRATVAGLSCQEWTLTSSDGERSDTCFTAEIAGSRDWLRAMSTDRDGMARALRQAGVSGFPIRVVFYEGDAPSGRMELARVERGAPPDSLFRVPAGYREVPLLTLMMTEEQAKKFEEQMKRQGR